MKKISLSLFGIAVLGELLSTLAVLPIVHLICKPALLITLLLYYIASQRNKKEQVSPVLMLALLFSLGGDVFLMGSGEKYFMLGLGSFLTAHIFYIFTLRQFRFEDDTNALHGVQQIRFAFPIILYGTGLVVILYPHLGEMILPVLLYALVLTVMVLHALFRFGRTSTPSFVMVFGGSILFMISDSLLAVNKFIEPVTLSGFWIMSTYISAQFLIVKGLIRHPG